jgi:hypothetical protein
VARVVPAPQARHLDEPLTPGSPMLALDGDAVESPQLALALDAHGMTVGQRLDQVPDAIAEVNREVRRRGAHELAHVLDRRLSLEAIGSLEFAHGL